MQRPGRGLLTGLLFVAWSPHFLIEPRTTRSGMALPTVGWALLHQLLIKKMPYRFAYSLNCGGISNDSSLWQDKVKELMYIDSSPPPHSHARTHTYTDFYEVPHAGPSSYPSWVWGFLFLSRQSTDGHTGICAVLTFQSVLLSKVS